MCSSDSSIPWILEYFLLQVFYYKSKVKTLKHYVVQLLLFLLNLNGMTLIPFYHMSAKREQLFSTLCMAIKFNIVSNLNNDFQGLNIEGASLCVGQFFQFLVWCQTHLGTNHSNSTYSPLTMKLLSMSLGICKQKKQKKSPSSIKKSCNMQEKCLCIDL